MTTIFLTSGTTWTVPSDWNSANNTIECIGGGGGGLTAATNVGTGGEGGHYAKSQNITLTPLASINIAIGTGGTGGSSPTAGGSTWFNGTSLATSSCGALGGAIATGTASNATTATTNDVGNVVVRQGGFGAGYGGNSQGGSGGGGAAGPGGTGGGGGTDGSPTGTVAGAGGGGAGNTGGAGSGGANATSNTVAGNGGAAGSGTAGGAGAVTAGAGGAGSHGSGGGGGVSVGGVGGNGGSGVDSSWDASHGPGGGGGGGGTNAAAGLAGGNGGLYGGGGGGAGWPASGSGGNGAQGIIVITYTPAVPHTTWNPSDKTAALTLSGSNLIATSTTPGNNGVRGVDKQITGKFYFEITANWATGGDNVGIGTAGAALNNVNALSTCAVYNSGSIFLNNVQPTGNPTLGARASGDVIGIAVDKTNHLIWFRVAPSGNWNGSGTANPATGIGGVAFASISGAGIPVFPYAFFNSFTYAYTANFGDTAFTGTVPSGFTSGWPTSSIATNALATQVGVEHWFASTAPAQVTQVGVEHWQSVANTPATPITPTDILSASRAGLGSVALFQDNATRTDVIADIGIVSNLGVGPTPQTLTDTVVSSDIYSPLEPFFKTLSDSAASADVFSEAVVFVASLSDSASASDSAFIPIFETLSDSIASNDTLGFLRGELIVLSDGVVSGDNLGVQSVFLPLLYDTVSSYDVYYAFVTAGAVLQCGPIPIFPILPAGFPVKLSIVMDTTLGTTKSLREMRVAQQTFPIWDIELLFEELIDQTQNQVLYGPFLGYEQFETLVGLWLMMYGQAGLFAFNAPWDYSRTDQVIAVGDGTTTDFPIFRTWGTGSIATEAPIGMVDAVTNVKLNGTVLSPTEYGWTRSYVNFAAAPLAGTVITMTLSYYYICRFVADEQDFEEFSKNRWAVPSLKFRAVYWPGCQ